MNFNTIEFLFLFLPPVLILFHLVPASLRLLVLLGSSVFFYLMSGDIAGFLLIVTIIWAGGVAYLFASIRHWSILLIAIGPPLGFLFLFKYLDFTLSIIGASAEHRSVFGLFLAVSLPAGISFYTFQVISYLIDVRDGKVSRDANPIIFATFATYFPQLIAGPILRYAELRDQLVNISTATRLDPNFGLGLKYLSVGLIYKTFFADVLRHHQEAHDLTLGGGSLDALFAVFSYSFVIYFDFWAYSLMAIGLAELFCIELPRNFREPYQSTSPKEFWRRWHVTLSFWLRDYVYLRLGGNQHYVRNILIVFIAVGIWHGAGWNFIVWGLYHAGLVLLYHVTKPYWEVLPRIIQIALTFVLVSFGWPLFYLDVSGYIDVLTVLFSFSLPTGEFQFGLVHWVYVAAIGIVVFATREDNWLFNEEKTGLVDNPAVHAVLCACSILFFHFGRTFIYFNF